MSRRLVKVRGALVRRVLWHDRDPYPYGYSHWAWVATPTDVDLDEVEELVQPLCGPWAWAWADSDDKHSIEEDEDSFEDDGESVEDIEDCDECAALIGDDCALALAKAWLKWLKLAPRVDGLYRSHLRAIERERRRNEVVSEFRRTLATCRGGAGRFHYLKAPGATWCGDDARIERVIFVGEIPCSACRRLTAEAALAAAD